MINRRCLILGIVSAFAMPSIASAHKAKKPFVLAPKYQPQLVGFTPIYAPGTVVVDPKNRFLYLVEGPGVARRYGVGVGRAGLAWSGTAEVARKAKWPSWRPTKSMIKRNPKKYGKYAGGVPGGRNNPLGSRALYLYRNGRHLLPVSWHDRAVDGWSSGVQRLHPNDQRACRRPVRKGACGNPRRRPLMPTVPFVLVIGADQAGLASGLYFAAGHDCPSRS